MTVTTESEQANLISHAARIRAGGILGKSIQVNRLFDFLLERSLAGDPPKEIEIAQTVFDKVTNIDVGLDATVRVCAHRLRKKLDEAPADEKGERIKLPRGEYRLVVTEQPHHENSDADPSPAIVPQVRRARPLLVLALVALAVILNVLGLVWLTSGFHADPRLQTIFWRDLAGSRRPTLLLSGDFYVFGERDSQGRLQRTVSDPAITSREDLDQFRMEHPDTAKKLVDLNAHDLPEGIGTALAAIAPIVNATAARSPEPVQSLTMSRFTTDRLSGNNIVYLGLINHLGDLKGPLFDGSGFNLADDDDTLVDRASGRRYHSDWADLSEQQVMRRDYGYLASLPGPSGNRVLIIAGTRDPGLMEAAQIVASEAEMNRLGGKLGSAAAFEALYEVRTFGPSNFSGNLIIARPLSTARMWPLR